MTQRSRCERDLIYTSTLVLVLPKRKVCKCVQIKFCTAHRTLFVQNTLYMRACIFSATGFAQPKCIILHAVSYNYKRTVSKGA